MKDRLVNEINIDDRCICYNIMRTGSSTKRLVQYEGEIVAFTAMNARVNCIDCTYREYIGNIFLCSVNNIFKLKNN